MISPGMSCCEHTLNTLRYADRYYSFFNSLLSFNIYLCFFVFRVKELGAEDGSNTPMEDEELMLSNIDEDYDILQSRNVCDLSLIRNYDSNTF